MPAIPRRCFSGPYRASFEEVTDSEFTGLPLGVIEGCSYLFRELHLEPGDIVIIFSDGIFEAMDVADHQLKR